MHTFTWSLVSRSARPGPGSRWPGTAVVAAVSSVTSLLRAGHRVAAHLQATYRHRRVPRNTPRRPVVTSRARPRGCVRVDGAIVPARNGSTKSHIGPVNL